MIAIHSVEVEIGSARRRQDVMRNALFPSKGNDRAASIAAELV